MTYRRCSNRLKGYDYSQVEAYFVTICTHNRVSLFGEVIDGQIQMKDAGWMVQRVWNEIPSHYPVTEIDQFVIMPNHIHGVIILVGAGPRACPDNGQPRGVAPTGLSLQDVVHRFKSLTTTRYWSEVKKGELGNHGGLLGIHRGLPLRRGKLWQRNYYEHIIRNDDDLNHVREYIINNPLQWQFDKENPGHIQDKSYDSQWGYIEEAIYGKTKK